jgi:hypothetical protein
MVSLKKKRKKERKRKREITKQKALGIWLKW